MVLWLIVICDGYGQHDGCAQLTAHPATWRSSPSVSPRWCCGQVASQVLIWFDFDLPYISDTTKPRQLKYTLEVMETTENNSIIDISTPSPRH